MNVLDKIRTPIEILPADLLAKTGPVDHADWNFGLLGPLQQERFRLVKKMLKSRKFETLLEMGYGSGIFMPELKRHAESLFGVDIHENADEVQRNLGAVGVSASLLTGSADAMPFADSSFNAVVSVSALEFVPSPKKACEEIRRVLKPGGRFVLVTPVANKFVDTALHLFTGESASDDYGNGRELTMEALHDQFDVEHAASFPPVGPNLYLAYSLIPKAA